MLGSVIWILKARNMVMYDILKNYGKIVKNSPEPIISNRGSFPVFVVVVVIIIIIIG
jgi:hypothetical protein